MTLAEYRGRGDAEVPRDDQHVAEAAHVEKHPGELSFRRGDVIAVTEADTEHRFLRDWKGVARGLTGSFPKALAKKNRLTATSLQDYLAVAVPKTIRRTFNDGRSETPWCYGGRSRDFQIADLTAIFEARAALKPGAECVKRAFLREEEFREIRLLSCPSPKPRM